MNSFLTRVISLAIAFVMLVIAPLVYSYSVTEMEERRELLNETALFLDKVTDKRSITEDDLTEFYLQVSSHGMVLKPTVKRLVRTALIDPDGDVIASYIAVDDLSVLNQKDVVQIELEEVTTSVYRRMMYWILRIDEGPYRLERAQMVR